MRAIAINSKKSLSFIVITFLVGFILTVLPLPVFLQKMSPNWILLILLYWVFIDKNHVGLGVSWLVGLITDLLTHSLLGQHALVFTLIVFLVSRFMPRMHVLPLWQQSIYIFFIGLLNLILQSVVLSYSGGKISFAMIVLPALTNIIVWPIILGLINMGQFRFRVIQRLA